MTMSALKPVYLLGGGPGADRSNLRRVLRLAFAETGQPAPDIAYVGAASGDDRGFFRMIAGYLRAAGSGEVRLAPMAGRGADLDEARDALTSAALVFISGGDVEEGVRVLQTQRMMPLLTRLHKSGVPFLGVSAGSIMLARQWVRWRDDDDDSTAEAFACLGFAPVLCDAHGEEDDWHELKMLLRVVGNDAVGYGIPTDGALCVWPDGRVTAYGDAVCRFSCRGATVKPMASLPPAPL